MTAAAWQQVLERIETQARELTPRQVLLTLIAAPLFVAGWLLAKTAQVAFIALVWAWVAGLEGWREAGGLHGRKQVEPL
jgi:phosphatidylglycerophosphate synthase